MIIYDATDQILGRMSSAIAKKLLGGEGVIVVNCEKAVLAGNPQYTFKHYLQRLQRGDPIHGPFFPRQPEGICRRAVRGMLPWDKTRGRKAYKKLRVFIGVPEEFKNKKTEKVNNADVGKLKTRFTTISELSIKLGAKKRW